MTRTKPRKLTKEWVETHRCPVGYVVTEDSFCVLWSIDEAREVEGGIEGRTRTMRGATVYARVEPNIAPMIRMVDTGTRALASLAAYKEEWAKTSRRKP